MKAAGLLSLDLEVPQCHFHCVILVKTSHQPVWVLYGKSGKVTFQRNRQGGVIGNSRVKIFEISSRELFFFFLIIELFIYFIRFGLRWVFVAAWAFPGCGERGSSSLQCSGLSLSRLLLLQSTGCRACGLQ